MYEITINCPNNKERNRIGNLLHNQFVGNKHYIDSDVILNIESDKEVKITIFPTEQFNFPDIIIPTSNLETHVDNDDPNTRYESKVIDIWNSVEDVDNFCKKYNHDNGYKGLSIGNLIRINNGISYGPNVYNTLWEIAGFDMEHNQKASDGSIYDNGYGICLIPEHWVTRGPWNKLDNDIEGGYMSSYIHTTQLPMVVDELKKKVLGDHIVLRNVLLSDHINKDYYCDSLVWTTAYATLLSKKQITGENAYSYDSGEANYQLPLFNYEDNNTGFIYCTRNIEKYDDHCRIPSIGYHGSLYYDHAFNDFAIRPMIYIR